MLLQVEKAKEILKENIKKASEIEEIESKNLTSLLIITSKKAKMCLKEIC